MTREEVTEHPRPWGIRVHDWSTVHDARDEVILHFDDRDADACRFVEFMVALANGGER